MQIERSGISTFSSRDQNSFKGLEIIYIIQKESLEILKDGISTPRKVQVTFSDGQWKLIETLRGTMGDTDSEIVRNIVISYLSEKSYIKEASKTWKQ
jgi:hypothetical protein